MDAFKCPGCNRSMKYRGWRNHLRQARDSRCKEILRQMKAVRPASESDNDSGSSSDEGESEIDESTTKVVFGPASAHASDDEEQEEPPVTDPNGDLFGNYGDYTGQDFGMDIDEGLVNVGYSPEESQSGEQMDLDDQELNDWLNMDGYDSPGSGDDDELGPEQGLEPPRANADDAAGSAVNIDNDELVDAAAADQRDAVESNLQNQPFIIPFGGQAGHPIAIARSNSSSNDKYAQSVKDVTDANNIYAPFMSRMDWEIARWAKLRGPSSTAFTELMSIDGVVEALSLSFNSSADINKKIDENLPASRPAFRRKEVMIADEVFEVWMRDIIPCVKALFGDQEFAAYLVFAPEKHYANEKKDVRMFHDMHTGRWWWTTQEILEKESPGATIIPIIISSDKTQVTLFRNKSAYPLYLTIGNIPKEIRRKPSCRAYILLAYLPTSRLSHIKVKAARQCALSNLYHACLSKIFAPLKDWMLYAVFIGDYPEQILTGGSKNGECPTCPTGHDTLGDFLTEASGQFRDLNAILDALAKLDTDPGSFFQSCKEAGIKPLIDPFWKDLPFAHPYRAITPDVLHQLYQGVVKHLLAWLTEAYGPVEIDARCRRLPPNHNIRIFMNGITSLSRVSGTEHDQMCRFLLGLIIDIPMKDGVNQSHRHRVVRATRAILDFLYLAQYPVHTDETLHCLDDALKAFHDNKQVFIDLGIRDSFDIPKLHFMVHYARSIKLFGTTDNFNTEYTERLHIDLAKDAYRATNRKDEYSQMTVWLERREKVNQHDKYVKWCLAGCPLPPKRDWVPPGLDLDRKLHLTKRPSRSATFQQLISDYGAEFFHPALARYIVLLNNPNLSSRADLEAKVLSQQLPFSRVPVWHRIKYVRQDAVTGVISTADSIHVQPARKNKRDKLVPQRFDTAFINDGTGGTTGVKGYRVGQVRVIFSIPKFAIPLLFPPGTAPAKHLAYIEWFTPFASSPAAYHLMYKVSRSMVPEGGRLSSIIPIANIRRSVHLLPKFGPVAPMSWTSSNVLDKCPHFFVNSFTDRHLYRILY
ncbi:hypothetical protein C8J56DRAFT_1013320 [Mycena floridula]|nr:hypothetical protein C8J56DRAFT_1013320 [Mycena floridula]